MTTLNDLAAALLAVTGFADDTTKDQIVRQINPTLNISCTHIVASQEPVGVVLPMNVVWLCMDVNSAFYRKFIARKNKQPSGGYQNTWEEVKNFNSFWAPQYYDPADLEGGADIPNAAVDEYGIARLTTEPASVGRPTFVAVSDPRNTDKRTPLPHDEMHPEKPLVEVKTVQDKVNMDATVGQNGSTFVADSTVKASYGQLLATDILEKKA
ncbi:hypothetical protein pEaSNUABM14_00162 [Erwinia phage pEa_SNUABM_14]|uniref:Uncharacterized protein n=1 Tax=Erwinia phage pEa_SNUABM_7 TaxID=2866695 RepID=A0AAE7WSF1_9CAUD|nr:hypothetical protein MPK74_gp163 [Erwinia phage pEa_SNUABM_7]QYW03122.1 hypothetical protein pEaSNUABM13_00163 [Erwinia phage pEa_SNUABM_13]QYW03463.1 hypothetical protein pEaSNUABM34_00161 [Erwinia phage pEa_SNUABM_34]QYW03805.1 hypothetical protein pEaSNUABM45_00162 [Erwinia phage pEa_SNUABM_45]QYW04146.1 hypothetical protein pEaSNUABM46_00162 [Erwinia phage pEa_SNUABM_46]QYW04487.1 hypothetical protein pEaSNUABM14_00162 [Erwinia phage pEa_SNUABM_14]QYW05176.1 hypothetical protein pEaSNU